MSTIVGRVITPIHKFVPFYTANLDDIAVQTAGKVTLPTVNRDNLQEGADTQTLTLRRVPQARFFYNHMGTIQGEPITDVHPIIGGNSKELQIKIAELMERTQGLGIEDFAERDPHMVLPWGEDIDKLRRQTRPFRQWGAHAIGDRVVDPIIQRLQMVVQRLGYLPGLSVENDDIGRKVIIDGKAMNEALSDPSLSYISAINMFKALAEAGRVVLVSGGTIDISAREFLDAVSPRLATKWSPEHQYGSLVKGARRFMDTKDVESGGVYLAFLRYVAGEMPW